MNLQDASQLTEKNPHPLLFRGRRVIALKALALVSFAFSCGALFGWLGPKFYPAKESAIDSAPANIWVAVRSADFRRVTGATLWLGDQELGRTDAFGIWQGEIPAAAAKKFKLLAKKGHKISEPRPIRWDADSNKTIKISLLLNADGGSLDPAARTEAISDWDYVLPQFPAAMVADQSLLQHYELQFSSRFLPRNLRSWSERTQVKLSQDLEQDGNRFQKGAKHLIVVSPVEGSKGHDDTSMILIEGFYRSHGEKTRIYSFLESLDLDAKALSARIRLGLDRLLAKPSYVYSENAQLFLSIPIYWAKSWSIGAQAKVFIAGAWRSLKPVSPSWSQFAGDANSPSARPLQVKQSEGLCPGDQPCPVLVVNGPALELNATDQRYWVRVPKGIVDPSKDVLYVSGYPSLKGRTNGMYTFVSSSLGATNVAILRDGTELIYRGRIDVKPGRVANLGPALFTASKLVPKAKTSRVAKKAVATSQAKLVKGNAAKGNTVKGNTGFKQVTSAKLSKSQRAKSPKGDRL